MPLSLMPTLARHDVERIHEHSLELLESVGIDYQTPRALEILEQAGCAVEYDRTWASLPRDVVEWALQRAPRVVRLCARDPARDVVLDGRRPHHTTSNEAVRAIDLETGGLRDSTAEDLRRALLFSDALDRIEIVNTIVAATDVPLHVRTIKHCAMAFAQTSKHVRASILSAEEVPFVVEMATAAAGSDRYGPVFSVVDGLVSPLIHDGRMTEACIELARLEVPILVYPMPLAGATSPVTLGGTILQHNVEFLSGLVLFQLVNPGTPIIYGTGACQLDMNTGGFGGSADGYGAMLALCDLARFYNLPVNLCGLSTASASLDAQYGHEATVAGLLSVLAGADEIYSMGLLDSAQTLSLEKMVLDNHLTRRIETMVGTIPVDEAHLQAELIERVGIGGHYLTQRETRDYTVSEYVPVWPPAGETMLEIVHEEALDILHNHLPPPLPAGAADQIEEIVAEADRELSRK
jgi:trimethylamine--corrinoid protein Co-methyltransferase